MLSSQSFIKTQTTTVSFIIPSLTLINKDFIEIKQRMIDPINKISIYKNFQENDVVFNNISTIYTYMIVMKNYEKTTPHH